MNVNQPKKYTGGYKGGGLKKGEVNQLRAKVQEQEELIQVLRNRAEQEYESRKEAYETINWFNNASFIDKLMFLFSDKKL